MELRIRVGAALDANVAGLFRPMVEGARRARAQIDAEFRAIGKAGGSAYRDAPVAAKKAADAEVAAARDAASKVTAIRRSAAEQRKRDEERSREHVLRIRQRYEAEEAKLESRGRERWLRQTSGGAVRGLGSTLRTGSRVAMDIARGAGVETNIGALVGKSVELQKRAIDLSNAGFMPAETLKPGEKAGANNQRVDPAELMKQAREVGNFAAFDPTRIMEGLQAFVGKTGDLATGRDVLKDMAQLSRATGSSLEDVVDAAGDVSNALGDTPNKGEKLAAIMRTVAGQGKIGAVEMKQLAVQMAKLGASATAFEGDAAENVGLMGAFAQMARAKGGAASATQAATSVATLVNTFKTPARMKAFEGATGKKVYNEKTGMLRNPEDLLMESLLATKGDPKEFKKIFANVQGARAVEGFATIFREARGKAQAGGADEKGATTAGLNAVRAEFDRYRKIAMGQGEIKASFDRSMGGDEAKVQLFNNKLAEVGSRIAERVLPQLERLAPTIIAAVDALGQLAAWVAENPLQALFTALGASILRSAGEATIRAGIEAAFRGAAGPSGPSAGGTGSMSNLGAGLTIAATAVTIASVGMLAIDKVMDMKDKAADNTQGYLVDLINKRQAYEASVNAGAPSPQAHKDLMAAESLLKSRIEGAEATTETGFGFTSSLTEGTIGRGLSGVANYITAGSVGTSFDAQAMREADREQLAELKGEMQKMNQALGRTIRVEVSNMPTPGSGPPTPDGAQRVGPSGDLTGFAGRGREE